MEAWLKRGSERQQLLEEIQHKIRDAEESNGVDGSDLKKLQEYYHHIVVFVTDYLLKGEPTRYDPKIVGGMFCDMEYSFHFTHFRTIREFSRAEEEERALLAELAKWAMATFINPFEHELRRKEISEPKIIFQADRAMTEV